MNLITGSVSSRVGLALLCTAFFGSCIISPERRKNYDSNNRLNCVAGLKEGSPSPVDMNLCLEASQDSSELHPIEAPQPDPEWIQLIKTGKGIRPLPAATEALHFSPGEAPTLAELLAMWSSVTGIESAIGSDTEQQLSLTSCGVPASRVVAASDVQSYVQMQLRNNNCYLLWAGGEDSLIVTAVSAIGRSASGLRSSASYVPSNELAEFKDQHALLIQTVLKLPRLDTRQLSTSLRSLLTDTNTQNLISAGPDSVILQGGGAQVYQIARMLAEISGSRQEPRGTAPEEH